MQLDFAKVDTVVLDREIPGMGDFKSRKPEMVEHLQRRAIPDRRAKIGTTWAWTCDKTILGYVSIAMFAIAKKDFEAEEFRDVPYATIPSLLIGQLATNKDYEARGMGRRMCLWAINKAERYSKRIGCRLVVLHPHDDVIDWYRKLEFKKIKFKDGLSIMYFDLLGNGGEAGS